VRNCDQPPAGGAGQFGMVLCLHSLSLHESAVQSSLSSHCPALVQQFATDEWSHLLSLPHESVVQALLSLHWPAFMQQFAIVE
jgi:hypothetical protein